MAEILWIDDQLEMGLEEMKEDMQVKHPDYHFTIAMDDNEGTKQLREKRFDLVILDIRMHPAGEESVVSSNTAPRKVGLELLKALREGRIEKGKTPRDVPIIVLSAIVDQKDQETIMAVEPPPTDFLGKPVKFPKFIEVIERSLEKSNG